MGLIGNIKNVYTKEETEALVNNQEKFLGTFTDTTRPAGLTSADVGKYCYLSDTKNIVFWTGTAWNDQDEP